LLNLENKEGASSLNARTIRSFTYSAIPINLRVGVDNVATYA